MQTYVIGGQETEPLGCVVSEEDKEEVTKSAAESNCKLLQLKQKPEVMLVQCSTEMLPEQTFSFTQQVCSFDFKTLN